MRPLGPPCKICGDKHYAKGYCRKHWRRFITHGSPYIVLRPCKAEEKCAAPGCDEKHYGLGLCNPHWQRMKRNGHLLDHWGDIRIRDYQFQDALAA